MPTGFFARATSSGIGLALLLTGWAGAAQAQSDERLPWERQSQSRQAAPYEGSQEVYRPQGQAQGYGSGDVYGGNPSPVIRQPRTDPYAVPGGQSEPLQPYDRDYGEAPRPRLRTTPPGTRYDEPRYGHDDGAGRPYEAPRYDDYRGPRNPDYRGDEPDYADRGPDGSYSMGEIVRAGGGFFGSVSKGLASVIEHAFRRSGRPNGYILGEGAGGAFVAGLRYGEGTLYTKFAGRHKVYWQGPSIGYDAGAEGSKTMVLVYNLRHPRQIYKRFGGVAGSAYLVGGVGITYQQHGDIVLAPIRAGVGLRLGANVGYLKYTRQPTWNPF